MQRVNGKYLPDLLRKTSMFYEADIRVDAILSFPWMSKNKIGVFPHLRAMALEKPQFTLLMGAPSGKPKAECKWTRLGQERRDAQRSTRVITTGDEPFTEEEPEEEHESAFLKLHKLGLCVEDNESPDLQSLLEDTEIEMIQKKLQRKEKKYWIRRLITTTEVDTKEEFTENLREAIHQDYGGTALRDTLIPGIHERGPYGFAYIPLKDGATPTRAKPIVAHGEKHEAYGKVNQDWLEKGFIERPWKKGIEW